MKNNQKDKSISSMLEKRFSPDRRKKQIKIINLKEEILFVVKKIEKII